MGRDRIAHTIEAITPPSPPVPPIMVTTDQAKLQIGTTLGGRYQLKELIGEGGFGKVYRGRQLNMERDVAVKVLPPRFAAVDNIVERFRREARLASKLRHPNTITLHDYGRQEDFFYIVMEYLQGEDLADRLKRQRIIDLPVAVRIARQTLESLQEAHELGIVHRDLKPENIFLTQMGIDDNFVKVLDFGIAKLAKTTPDTIDDKGRQLTVQGNTVGTPAYMSPEQAAGEPVSATSDLYTLGLILYEMVNGSPPFVCDRPIRTMRAHLFDPVPAFSNEELRNTQFESLVRKALAKDEDQRFESAAEFADALAQPNLTSQSFGFHRLRRGSSDGSPSGDSIPEHAFNTPIGIRRTPSKETAGVEATDEVPFEALADSKARRSVDSPPAGFTSQGSVSSSIITVLEPNEDEVIVLTKKKSPDQPLPTDTDHLQSENLDDESPSQSHGDWKWSDDMPAADASGSQILTDFHGNGRRRRLFMTAGLVIIALFFVALLSGSLLF
jgi:eukaryotic-like serine/threonine-protein kinase